MKKSDVFVSSYNTTSETRPSIIISRVTSGPSYIEINELNVQLLQSNLVNTTLTIVGKSDHSTKRSNFTKININTRHSFPKSKLGQKTYSSLKMIKPVILLINSSVQQVYGQAIHMEMSDCFITVNTHPPLSPMFVIENSTANITNCQFHGDSNAWAMNLREYTYALNQSAKINYDHPCTSSMEHLDPKDISSVLFVFKNSNITIRTCNFEGIHMGNCKSRARPRHLRA